MNKTLLIRLALALGIYISGWFLMYPWLGYILDSDGVAYLTIAERVAKGQLRQSVNALWSPMNSWVLAPFIARGFNPWQTALWFNLVAGGITLVLGFFLIHRFKWPSILYNVLSCILPVVMIHHAYLQMFGDILQLIFCLLYLIWLSYEPGRFTVFKTIGLALLMGIGFYAKAYSLIFFISHWACVCALYLYRRRTSWQTALFHYALGFFIIILTVLPWSIALWQKYHRFSLSGFAGSMNLSWQINSGKTFKPDIKLLIPPTYSDSPSFWEDPYPTQGKLSTPLSSPQHFVRWLARVVHTTLTLFTCMSEISVFAFALWLISFLFLFVRPGPDTITGDQIGLEIIWLAITCLPLGYLLMHIETRYLWLLTYLLIIPAFPFIRQSMATFQRRGQQFVWVLLAGSFLIHPVLDMEVLKNKNKDLFITAAAIRTYIPEGKSFTSNALDAGRMWVIAYLNRQPFYTIERTDYTAEELYLEMKRLKVDYFYYVSENNKPNLRLDETRFQYIAKLEGVDLFRLK